jgi:hypothetical protein
MSASRSRWLLVGFVLTLLAVPAAAFADEPTTETTTSTTTTSTTTTEDAVDPCAETPATRRILARAIRFRDITRRWRLLMRLPGPTLLLPQTPFGSLLAKRRWVAHRWYGKAMRARELGHHPPHKPEWRCIHGYEAPWTDPGARYYGGLQMDIAFQRTYALGLLRRKGTANRWTPLEQMWVAERAHRAAPRLPSLAQHRPLLRAHLGGLRTANWSVTSRFRVRKR